jgi:hypothetical protein
MPAEFRLRVPVDLARELEAVTSLVFDDRMMYRSAQEYVERPGAEVDLRAALRQMRHLISSSPITALPQTRASVHSRDRVRRAVQLGLLEEGTGPETIQPRYFVSNVLRPLIRPLITDDEYTESCAAGARSLYKIWVTADPAGTDSAP